MSTNYSQRSDISTIKLPTKITSVGRPKGSEETVIGTKKKDVPRKRNPNETVISVPVKRKFLDLSDADQSMKTVQWLTKKHLLK